MNNREITQMNAEEIWEGWCGNAAPGSDEGTFLDMADAVDYVRNRIGDWRNEPLETDGDEITRYISDMTETEINYVARMILQYSKEDCMQKEGELDAQEAYERNVQDYMDYRFRDEEEATCRNER